LWYNFTGFLSLERAGYIEGVLFYQYIKLLMQNSDYFVWNADPVALDIGTVQLPFPIAIWGIVAAFVFIYLIYRRMVPADLPEHKQPEIPQWKVWGIILGSLVLGQLLFLVLPSPTISQIGPIQPRWYGFLFASSFVVGYLLMRRMYLNAGRTQEELDSLLTYVIIATVVGARLGHVIFYDLGFYLRNPGEIIAIWHGGLASHGAAAGILLAMYLYVQKHKDMSFLWLADRVVIVVAIGGAFIRTGNFFNSEILGEPTDLPWAVIFAKVDMIPRHPTMLYEALLCVAIFALLWTMYKYYDNEPPEGSIFGTFLVLLFGGRFLLEYTKVNQASFTSDWALNMGQWLSVPLIAAGIWLLWKKVRWKRPVQNV
jgi:prolipoprotein diacylglyceryl transferase